MAQVIVHRSHGSGPSVGFCHTCLKLLVETFEFADALLFMGEHLYHSLAVHHLFNVSIHYTKVLLLGLEVCTRLLSQKSCGKECNEDEGNDYQKENPAVHSHGHQDHQKGHGCSEKLHQAIGHQLVQGICIIGKAAHDGASSVPVEIGERQRLKLIKHLDPHVIDSVLGNAHHYP